jgi:hypothetical protein
MKDLGGFLLSYIFGNSILGKDPVPGEIYQEFDQKGNLLLRNQPLLRY